MTKFTPHVKCYKTTKNQQNNKQKTTHVFSILTGGQKTGVTNKSANETPFSDDACVHTKLVETTLIVEMCCNNKNVKTIRHPN